MLPDFLQRLQGAQAKSELKNRAHREARLAAGLQAAAGTGPAEPEIVMETLPTSVPSEIDFDNVDIADLPKINQAIEAATLENLPMGASRLGGLPDLPAAIEWPIFQGKRLPFIAQVNLSEIPRSRISALPNVGWFYVFGIYNDEYTEVAVFTYDGDSSTLVRRERPDADEMWSDWTDMQFYSTVPLRVAKSNIESVRDNLGGWLFGEMSETFGTPGEMADRAMKDGDDWINLLAVTSVGNMEWSDSGHLYLLIRRSDLAKSDFRHVLVTVASS